MRVSRSWSSAAPVHADAHRLFVPAGELDHLGELRITLAATPDVSGIDAVLGQRFGALRIFPQQLVPVEMKVADDGNAHTHLREAVTDGRHGRGGRCFVDRDAHQLGARARQRLDLLRRALDVGRVGVGHRLHDDGRGSADRHAADVHGEGLAARMAHAFTSPRPSSSVEVQVVSCQRASRQASTPAQEMWMVCSMPSRIAVTVARPVTTAVSANSLTRSHAGFDRNVLEPPGLHLAEILAPWSRNRRGRCSSRGRRRAACRVPRHRRAARPRSARASRARAEASSPRGAAMRGQGEQQCDSRAAGESWPSRVLLAIYLRRRRPATASSATR